MLMSWHGLGGAKERASGIMHRCSQHAQSEAIWSSGCLWEFSAQLCLQDSLKPPFL